MEMNCTRIHEEDVIEAYLLGSLDDDVAAAFELHVFGCPHCLEVLETFRVARHELATNRKDIEKAPTSRSLHPPLSRPLQLAAIVVVIVAAVVFVSLFERPNLPEVNSIELAELAHFEPAPYTPVTLRGDADEADTAFRDAMESYLYGNYRSAAKGLETASALAPDSPKIGFYLGVSLLLAGETDAAIARLKRTIDLGDTLYLEMARFYLAKAYAISGDLDAARNELETILSLQGDLEEEAERLLGLLPDFSP